MRATDCDSNAAAWPRDDTVARHRVWSATVIGLALWLAVTPGTALAHPDPSIWGAGGGPMLAIGSNGDLTVGWEVSGVAGSPVLHFALGGDYMRGASRAGTAHYLAWEPGFVGGGSLGASLPDGEPGLYVGAWAGLGWPSDPRTIPIEDSDYSRLVGVVFTFCIGYRFIGGAHQFYLAPKLGYYEFPNPNS